MSGGNYKGVAGIESTSRKNGRNTKIKHLKINSFSSFQTFKYKFILTCYG